MTRNYTSLYNFRSDEELHASTEHHRKRHEEVDCCPEEIKLMKVACEELTLECSGSTPNSPDQKPAITTTVGTNNSVPEKGPKFCLKSLTSQEVPEKDNSIRRHPEIK